MSASCTVWSVSVNNKYQTGMPTLNGRLYDWGAASGRLLARMQNVASHSSKESVHTHSLIKIKIH